MGTALFFSAKLGKKLQLQLLYLHQATPLVGKKMVHLFMEMADFQALLSG